MQSRFVRMTFLPLVATLLLQFAYTEAGDGSDWKYTYSADGTEWDKPDTCKSVDRQSPRTLEKATPRNYPAFELVLRNDKTTPFTCNIVTGHPVQCDVGAGDVKTSGGGWASTGTLAQFHIHWGQPMDMSKDGSEHRVPNQVYQGEVHFVHKFADKTAAVLGYFLKVGKENALLKELFEKLTTKKTGALGEFEIDVRKLLNLNKDAEFYRYKGSLTTPGCNEIVLWTVFKTPLEISEDQYESLSSMKDASGNEVVNTFRVLQDKKNKQTLYMGKANSAPTTLTASFVTVAMSVVMHVLMK